MNPTVTLLQNLVYSVEFTLVPIIKSPGYKLPGIQPVKEKLPESHLALQYGPVPEQSQSHFLFMGRSPQQLRNVSNVTELPVCQRHGGKYTEKLSLLFSWLR